MFYTFIFDRPFNVITFESKTIYGALRELVKYMVERRLPLCSLAPYYQTPKRSFLFKDVHINFIEKELLS